LQPARGEQQWRDQPSTLTWEDADAVAADVPNILGTMPELQGNYTVRYQRQDHQVQVTATSERVPQLRNWPLAEGVFFTREDSNTYAPVAVLGATARAELFPNGENPLGEFVLIGNIPFQIIGVLTAKG